MQLDSVPELPAKFAPLGLTYDDVLLIPGASDVVPAEVDTTSRLTRRLRIAHIVVQAALVWDDGEELSPGPVTRPTTVPLSLRS